MLDTVMSIVMFIIFVVTSFFGALWARLTSPPVPASPLVMCEWSNGGGMQGGYELIKITRSGDVAVISTASAEWHNSKPKEATYSVPLETLDEIKAIFEREGMNAYPGMPMRPEWMRALDADTWSMRFMFDEPGRFDARHFRFFEEQALPIAGYEAVREIREILRERIKAASDDAAASAHAETPPVPGAPLVECVWKYGGGMLGGHDMIKIERSGDAAVITTSRAGDRSAEPEEARYEAPIETLDEIKAIFTRAGLNACPKMPRRPNQMIPDDAPVWEIHFTFADSERGRTRFPISQWEDQPEGCEDAVNEILELLRERIEAASIAADARAYAEAPPVPEAPLIECRWTLGGGMRGGHDIIKIARSGDAAVITTSYAEWHNSEPEEAACDAPLETLDEIKAIFAREGMSAWPKLPMRDERMLDADTWSMSFSFDGPGRYAEKNFSFSEEHAIPDKGREAVREIRNIMRERIKAATDGAAAERRDAE